MGMSWPPSPKVAGWAGVAVPLVFWTGIALATWLSWDFLRDHGWEAWNGADADIPWPSGTALSDHGWVQNLNFAVTGVLLFVFARGFRRVVGERRSGRIAAGLFTIGALALLASTLNTDMGGSTPDTWHGWVHLVAFFVLMLSSLAGLVAAALAVRGRAEWRWHAPFTVLAFVVFFLGFAFSDTFGFYLVLLALFGWFGVTGFRMQRHEAAR